MRIKVGLKKYNSQIQVKSDKPIKVMIIRKINKRGIKLCTLKIRKKTP